MGAVSNALQSLIQDQLHTRRVVVWFDPGQDYASVADSLAAALATVNYRRFEPDTGFFGLRHGLEGLWSAGGDEPPSLLIYVPGYSPSESHDALVEYTVVGSVMAPGQQPPECNTALTAVARRALALLYPPAVVEKHLTEIEHSHLSLQVVEQLAELGAEAHTGQLALIFQTGNSEEILLRFLADTSLDAELLQRGAAQSLIELLAAGLELPEVQEASLPDARARAVRLVLGTEFVEALGENTPSALKSLPHPSGRAARETARQLAQTWRQRRDLSESYVAAAQRVEVELNLASLSWTLESLTPAETFLRGEIALQGLVETALLGRPAETMAALAQNRQNGFWAMQKVDVRNRWKVIARAGEVLLGSARLERELKADLTAIKLLTRYTEGETPWCDLDTAFRQLDSERHLLDHDTAAQDSLLQLVSAAEQRYVRSSAELINRFVRAYQSAKFDLPGFLPQIRIFKELVAPSAEVEPTAYILVDGLRYEMARELLRHLPEDYTCELKAALATPPTITEVGMAALLPGAERGLTLTMTNDDLRVSVNGVVVRTSQERLRLLAKTSNQSVEVVPLHKLLSLADKKLRQKLGAARLIVVTASDEVDGLWENNPGIARQLPDFVEQQLRNGLHTLFGIGIRRAIITADHGYLLGQQLQAGEGIEAPGGKTAVLKRRVWVGKGGAALESCLREPISSFGLGGDVELMTPYEYAYFSVPGQLEYFHGGLSPQELVIPVISITPGSGAAPVTSSAYHITVNLSRPKVTTRVYTVTLTGETGDMFAVPPRVQVQLQAGDQLVAMAAAAVYGYQDETHDIALAKDAEKPGHLLANAVTLLLPEGLNAPSLRLVVLDAETGVGLWQSGPIPIEIAL